MWKFPYMEVMRRICEQVKTGLFKSWQETVINEENTRF